MEAKDDEVYELKQACEDLQDDIAGFQKKERKLLSFSREAGLLQCRTASQQNGFGE